MAMVVQAIERPRMPPERAFYLSMVGAILIAVLVGFARSVFLRPLFPGVHAAPEPFFYVHGAMFIAWLVLLATQAALITTRNLAIHQRLGVVGFAMVPVITGFATYGGLLAARRPGGFTDIPLPPLEFLTVPISNIVVFALLAGMALALRRNPQAHKRLMLLGTIAVTEAAVARWPSEAILTNPALGFWLTCAFIIPLVIWDLVSRRNLHWATLVGAAAVIAQGPMRDWAAHTTGWLSFARWSVGLLG
jgi:hypothetical protein